MRVALGWRMVFLMDPAKRDGAPDTTSGLLADPLYRLAPAGRGIHHAEVVSNEDPSDLGRLELQVPDRLVLRAGEGVLTLDGDGVCLEVGDARIELGTQGVTMRVGEALALLRHSRVELQVSGASLSMADGRITLNEGALEVT